jgi:hypothetical protein
MRNSRWAVVAVAMIAAFVLSGCVATPVADGSPPPTAASASLDADVRAQLEKALDDGFVASVVGRRVVVVPGPVWAQFALAQVTEWTMKVPLVAKAQVRMLAEGVTDAAPPAASVPDDLRPRRMFTAALIRGALPEAGGFGWSDLRVGR